MIEMMDKLGDGGNFLHMIGLEVEIAKQNIDIQAQYEGRLKSSDKGVVGVPVNG